MNSKIILIIGFVICLIPYALVFGLPIYFLGIIILLLSNEKKIKKIYWISISGLLLIILYTILILYIQEVTGEKFTL